MKKGTRKTKRAGASAKGGTLAKGTRKTKKAKTKPVIGATAGKNPAKLKAAGATKGKRKTRRTAKNAEVNV